MKAPTASHQKSFLRIAASRTLLLPLALGLGSLLFAGSIDVGRAAEPDAVAARLARIPQPWKSKPNRFTRAEYEETLRYWGERHRQQLTVEERGKSVEGIPLELLKITDAGTPDYDKQVCLITALHSGPERSGTTTILHLAEWLLGDDDAAAETRHKQIVLLMPIVNPWSFFVSESGTNSKGANIYDGRRGKLWDVPALALREPAQAPEITALLSVVDQYRPEVHADIHGISLHYNGQLVYETVGSAGSNFSLRPWDWRVSEAMIAAAQQAGYGADRWEADAQRMFWGPELEAWADKLWLGRVFFYNAHYAYMKYHTLLLATENGWEQGGVARLKGLLGIGNRVWEGEPSPGYPVNRLKMQFGHFVVAWGDTAQRRRASRVELWERQAGFTLGGLYPQTDGRVLTAYAITKKGAALLDANPQRFLTKLRGNPQFEVAPLEAFIATGPETKLIVEAPTKLNEQPIEQGIGLRLRLSYRNPDICDLRLNGRLLRESSTDGYQRWYADGFTQVQINVPPAKSRTADLLVVSCGFVPDEQRTYGWRPPAEVLRRLQARPPAATAAGKPGT